MAQIAFEGRLTKDAEIQYGASGKARAKFTVAENHRGKNQQGEWEDQGATFHNVVLFGRMAESAPLTKGTVVTVAGTQKSRAYDKDGEKRQWTETTCNSVGIVPIPQRGQQAPPQSGGYGAPAADPWGADPTF